jgi:hypothetical protein
MPTLPAVPQRFFRRGVSEVWFLPSVAVLAAPTSSEFTAGINVTPAVQAVNGFSIANEPIRTPDLATSFDSQIDGVDSAEDSGLTFYDDKVDVTLRTALAKGTNGYIVLCPYGKVATKRCEVWPVRSTGFNDEWGMDAAATAGVRFAVTKVPVQNAVLP